VPNPNKQRVAMLDAHYANYRMSPVKRPDRILLHGALGAVFLLGVSPERLAISSIQHFAACPIITSCQ
jgi:hypothetical protein